MGPDPAPLLCVGRVPILLSFTIGNALRYLAEVFEHDDASTIAADPAINVDLGEVDQIVQGVDLQNWHETGAVLGQVTSQSPGASISFATQPAGLGAMQYASMRLGVRTRIDLQGQPDVTVCDAVHEGNVPLTMQVSDGDSQSAEVTLQPLLQQDAVVTSVPGTGSFCEPQLFLATQRVPMADLCQGAMLDVSNLESWTFSFPEGVAQRDEVVFDTLELTTLSSGDAGVGQCPVQTALWGCEASTSLTPQRPTCTVEPQSGTCPSPSVVYEALAVPEVPQSWGGPFPGFVVNMPPGFSDDPWNPTSELDDAMAARCVAACERFYSGDPTVDVDCDDPQAFDDVWLIEAPAEGALRRISARREDGSGLFQGESLNCSLLDSCCMEFDEDACPATPRRTTPATYPIGVRQESVIDLDSAQSKLEVTDGITTDSVDLYGDLGFSRCRDGNDNGPCPFYLGSLTAKSIGAIQIPVTCPNQQVVHRTLYHLEVDLAQPAMGMAQEGTDEVGFPAGALVFEASFTKNGTPMTVRGFNQLDVVGTAGQSNFEFGDIVVFGEMPACWGQDDIPVAGTFELVLDLTGGVQESPPTVEIDIPSSVPCPSSVDLDATAGDPDADLDSVRWYIDDVLIDTNTTSVTFSGPHEVRAVAYDVRGAAATDVETVSCQ